MLRNLNREYSRGRVCGTNKSGTLGSAIPSTGDPGAGYAYSSLSLPADADNEYQGYITSVPTGLALFTYEDTSFVASANDGTYVVPWELYENGVLVGTTSFTLTFGDGTFVSCTAGNGQATGNTASVSTSQTTPVLIGDALASGSLASIFVNVSVQAQLGAAEADGSASVVSNSSALVTSVGESFADGCVASITTQRRYILNRTRTVTLKRKSRIVAA